MMSVTLTKLSGTTQKLCRAQGRLAGDKYEYLWYWTLVESDGMPRQSDSSIAEVLVVRRVYYDSVTHG